MARNVWFSVKAVRYSAFACSLISTTVLLHFVYRNRVDIVAMTGTWTLGVSLPRTGTNYRLDGGPASYPDDKSFEQMSMRERAEYVRARCAERSEWSDFTTLTDSPRNDAFLFNDEYNITLCFNRKVASTNIRRVFYMLANRETINDVNEIETSPARHVVNITEINVNEVRNGRNIRVIFVRDPLERLLSAYRDNRGFKDLRVNLELTFKEFLQGIGMKTNGWDNMHMESYFDTCRPCEVDYDYIGMTETFDADIGKLLQHINAEFVNLPQQNKTGYEISSREEMAQYLSDVSPRLLDFIYTKYRLDYYMFGFQHPKHWLNDT